MSLIKRNIGDLLLMANNDKTTTLGCVVGINDESQVRRYYVEWYPSEGYELPSHFCGPFEEDQLRAYRLYYEGSYLDRWSTIYYDYS